MNVEIVELEHGQELTFPVELSGDLLFFGRGAQKPGFIPLPQCGGKAISKVHCTLLSEAGQWWFVSGQPGGPVARNGCYLNGKAITRPVRLEEGQVFLLWSPSLLDEEFWNSPDPFPSCEILLRVKADRSDLEDTLTPAIQEVCQGVGGQGLQKVHTAIEELYEHLAENRKLDQEGRAQLSRLALAKNEVSEQLRLFRGEAQDKFEALEREVNLSKQQALILRRNVKRLLWVVCGFGLVIAANGILSFNWRQQMFESLLSELLYALMSVVVLIILKRLDKT